MPKEDILEKLAQEDRTYCLWRSTYEEFAPLFETFADSQPEEIRNILWGYAESGRLMQQRKVNLACEYMDFTEI